MTAEKSRNLLWLLGSISLMVIAIVGVSPGIRYNIPLSASAISSEQGFAYTVVLPKPYWPFKNFGDSLEEPHRSKTKLFENGKRLGAAHSIHDVIRNTGGGSFSHWGAILYLSTSDNSDPRTNGRTYKVTLNATLPIGVVDVLVGCLVIAFYCNLQLLRKLYNVCRISLVYKNAPGLRRESGYLIIAVSLAIGGFYLASRLTNVNFWLAVTAGVIASVFALGNFCRCIALILDYRPIVLLPFQKTVLVIIGVMAVVVGTEGFLQWRESRIRAKPDIRPVAEPVNPGIARLALAAQFDLPLAPEALENIRRRSGVLTLPAEWERRWVTVPGARAAEVWHGVLHVYDENYFRRRTPFPPRQPGVFRLMVVGDSMTYGYGVDEKYIYPTVLQKLLEEKFDIEVLALGRNGAQSEDILNIIRQFLPKLQPDLVVYGFVHNDFLPSQVGEYADRGFAFPIPDTWKSFLTTHSRFARFMSDAYDASLRSAGLRGDFFDDILKDFEGYQRRFARDIAEMNQFVTAHGLPPVISMVLHQFVNYGGHGYKISKIAEQSMQRAGMDVIETEEYYQRFNGQVFRVSLWEGHADEMGHAIFASMIGQRLENHPALQPFRKGHHQTRMPSNDCINNN